MISEHVVIVNKKKKKILESNWNKMLKIVQKWLKLT